MTASLDSVEYSVVEGTSVTICVILIGNTERTVAFTLTTMQGSTAGLCVMK